MNFKAILFAGIALTSLHSQASLINPIHKYIHSSGKVMELQGVSKSSGTAYYFDYQQGERVTVNLSDVSKETKQKINGVSAGDFVFAYTETGAQICTTYNVFENGMSYLGCRTGKALELLGPARFEVAGYVAHTDNLKAGVREADGFSLDEVVRVEGLKVKIKAIFESGYALVESTSLLSKLDTSSTLLKTSVKIVSTKDLEKL